MWASTTVKAKSSTQRSALWYHVETKRANHMKLVKATKEHDLPLPQEIEERLLELSESKLQSLVQKIAFPRPMQDITANRQAMNVVINEFTELGYKTILQGRHDNVIAGDPTTAKIIIGAHYDSVSGTPGANDNGSAIAVMLHVAGIVGPWNKEVCYIAFNGEEDGLLGSKNFVEEYIARMRPKQVHILEMVGHTNKEADSQMNPLARYMPGAEFPTVGDFLGIIANDIGVKEFDEVIANAGNYATELPVFGIKLPWMPYLNIDPILLRSDHAPFWRMEVPAIVWTDTSESRVGSHYHKSSDTWNTLDYEFMVGVARLLSIQVLRSIP